jgi:hypothetical protein
MAVLLTADGSSFPDGPNRSQVIEGHVIEGNIAMQHLPCATTWGLPVDDPRTHGGT